MKSLQVSVTFTGDAESITRLIDLAPMVIGGLPHNNLPTVLWYLLLEVNDLIGLEVKQNEAYNPWRMHEWEEQMENWDTVRSYCISVAKQIDELKQRYPVED